MLFIIDFKIDVSKSYIHLVDHPFLKVKLRRTMTKEEERSSLDYHMDWDLQGHE
eukprot:c44301_g1_i1 orf=228-389(+)